ncbi:hypothetical protein HHI36_016626 [Cryptolaemus montrouzieri]|uniref:HTH CENPB-type domain-containing protein n=1 Tax=Cryptolaemus montrouzieri TaxID=559131 RepID=A0ABD2NK83_9CUCU
MNFSLKDFMVRNENHPNNQQIVPNLGRLFALTIALEVQLFNYIIKMQELGFELTVQMVCRTAYRLAEHGGRQNFFGRNDKQSAGKWWTEFKKRYNLSLRVSENLAAYRASMAIPKNILNRGDGSSDDS